MSDHDDLIAQFVGVAAVGPQEARHYLEAAQWDLQSALTGFYNPATETAEPAEGQDGDEAEAENEELPTSDVSQPTSDGGRRLGEDPTDPQPILTTSSSLQPSKPPKKAPQHKKFATLGDLGGDARGRDDEHDSDDNDDKHDLFAGGEKSGLAVQNPDDLKKKIIEKARMNKARPGGDDPTPESNHFTGTAHTLGGDDAPSQTIEQAADPSAVGRAERVRRVLHFWSDGFSVDEGDLYSTSDPRNAEILNGIKHGRAPLSIMNVLPGQEVDVEITQHEEKYVKPKPKYKPFGGQGNRLGSPTPGDNLTSPRAEAAAAPAPAAPEASDKSPAVEIDESQPVISLQIRLGNGTRLPSRFNGSHTIGDVYNFVSAASPESQTRGWALMTTFPSQELTDKETKLGEMPDFKRGGVVVQKWT